MRCEILIGGKAGQGPNFLSELLANSLIKEGYYVFYSRDYQSLIRGGHNFNQVSFSDSPVFSNVSKINVMVCLDENTSKLHKKELTKDAIVVDFVQGKGNTYFAGVLFKILEIPFSVLETELKNYGKFEENLKDAKDGYSHNGRSLKVKIKKANHKLDLLNGSEATALSAIKSGLDLYYAYPMTPATPLMMELGTMQLEGGNHHKVIEVENEIAVALAGIGSSVVGKRVMVGTAGGGFDLMTESLSFAAMTEVPLVFYLAQRPGPGTGVATYTSQGDLNLALYSGHGEFFRLVLAPGDNDECIKLTNDAFYFSHKYRVPSIVLTDKHLGESKSLFDKEKSLKSVKEIKSSVKVGERFNSYEHDKKLNNIATEDAEVIKSNFEVRMKKEKAIIQETERFEQIKVYGNKNSKNLILSWGSTKGAILDAINENKIDAKFVQVLYMNPFPIKQIKDVISKAKRVLVVENNSESPLARLIAEKTGVLIEDKNKILRYDGRPFFSDGLAEEIRRRLR
ncbi:MAG: 2-oxoacid:acceptor oxidoreductase family protein [archaeon]